MSDKFNLSIFLFFVLFLLLVSGNATAQVNTEKFRKFGLEEGFHFNVQSLLTVKSGNTEYNSIKGAARIDHIGSAVDYFLVGNIESKNTGKNRIQNEGFAHLRAMWNFAPKTNWEFFVQRQYDEFVDLRYRNLGGTAIKYRFLQAQSMRDTTSSIDFNISTGFMYEHENYNFDPENIDRRRWRSTNFISFDWLIRERMSFTGVVYYQPAFDNFNDFRVSAETTLEFSILRRFYFTFQMLYKYNNLPDTDVKRYDFSLENGLRFSFP